MSTSSMSTSEDRLKEQLFLTATLKNNGYPTSVIRRVSRSCHKVWEDVQKEPPKATVVLPYIQNVSEAIKRILTPLNIRIAFQPYKTFREILVHPKDSVEESKRSGVVYLIPCKDCRKVYIGQTGHSLKQRVTEHKRALSSLDCNTSAIAEHAIKKSS